MKYKLLIFCLFLGKNILAQLNVDDIRIPLSPQPFIEIQQQFHKIPDAKDFYKNNLSAEAQWILRYEYKLNQNLPRLQQLIIHDLKEINSATYDYEKDDKLLLKYLKECPKDTLVSAYFQPFLKSYAEKAKISDEALMYFLDMKFDRKIEIYLQKYIASTVVFNETKKPNLEHLCHPNFQKIVNFSKNFDESKNANLLLNFGSIPDTNYILKALEEIRYTSADSNLVKKYIKLIDAQYANLNSANYPQKLKETILGIQAKLSTKNESLDKKVNGINKAWEIAKNKQIANELYELSMALNDENKAKEAMKFIKKSLDFEQNFENLSARAKLENYKLSNADEAIKYQKLAILLAESEDDKKSAQETLKIYLRAKSDLE